MTLGRGYETGEARALTARASADRLVSNALTGAFEASPALEVNRTIDPSDGANYAGGSSYSPYMPLLPSSAGLVGVVGAGGAQGILDKRRRAFRYMKRMVGKPWPSVLRQGPIAAGYIDPTEKERSSSIYEGWNAASQAGAAPGLDGCVGCRFGELGFGGLTYQQAMNYSPAPLTDNLGNLQVSTQISGNKRSGSQGLPPLPPGINRDAFLKLARRKGVVFAYKSAMRQLKRRRAKLAREATHVGW